MHVSNGIASLYAGLAVRLRDAGHDVSIVSEVGGPSLDLPGIGRFFLPCADDLSAHRGVVAEFLHAWRPDVVDCPLPDAEILTYAALPRAERAATVVRGTLSAPTRCTGAAGNQGTSESRDLGGHAGDREGVADTVEAERALVATADLVCAVSETAAQDLARVHDIPLPPIVAPGVDRARFHPGPVLPPTSGYRVDVDPDGRVRDRIPLSTLAADDELPAPWGPADGRPRVLWVGTISLAKGWDRLERLAEQLRDQAQLVVLLGHARPDCPVTLTDMPGVTVLQDLDGTDLVSLYRASDWLLSTARWTGAGLAAAEARACGTPLLLPGDLLGGAELLAHGDGQIYTTDADLADILNRRPTSASLSGLSWDDTTAETLKIYYSVVSRLVARS
jgi:glycosyltransferase involved in cell wall biosynthesis